MTTDGELYPGLSGKLSADAPWRRKVRRQIDEYMAMGGLTQEKVAAKLDVSTRSLRSWTGQVACPVPNVPTLRSIAKVLGYPMAMQLSDLGVLESSEVAPSLGISRSVLAAQIGRILDAAAMVRPGTVEMANAVLESCRQTGDIGRWRTRLFDVQVGTEFPRVGYHGLEVVRWRGAGALDTKPEGKHVPTDLRTRVEKLIPDEEQRIMYAGGQWSWQRGTPGIWERAEIVWRMRSVIPLVTHNRYGIQDWSTHRFLVHRSVPIERHIFLEPAGSHLAPDPATTTRLAEIGAKRSGPGLPERLVLISPPDSGGVPVARLLADGLGWDSVSIQQMAGALTGLPLRIAHGPLRENEIRRAINQILLVPPALPTIYSIPVLPTDDTKDAWWTAIGELADDSSVIVLALGPSDETALKWYIRQQELGTVSLDPPAKRAADQLGMFDKIVDRIAGRPRSATGTVSPTLAWDDENHFEAPEIGDYRLRTAYELCHMLVHGQLAGKSPRRSSFADRSALGHYEEQLRKAARSQDAVVDWTSRSLNVRAVAP